MRFVDTLKNIASSFNLPLQRTLHSVRMRVNKNSIRGVSLDAAGLVALADLSTLGERTALTGSASFLDILVLAPGIHTQQEAVNVNGGELPATGAMTTGYVFRVENQATVSYLQKIGEPGHLTVVHVEKLPVHTSYIAAMFSTLDSKAPTASLLYMLCIMLTVVVLAVLGAIRDWWAFAVLGMLVVARFLNTIVIKRRTQAGWKGAEEPGVQGDLLVLLSQDRWVRVRGLVDDLKMVTAGQWMREQEKYEGFASACGTLLVYVSAALASNASTLGSLLIGVLLLVSVALIGLCNSFTHDLRMFGCRVYVHEKPKKYVRRLDMAQELIGETGRNDWAIAMGLILPSAGSKASQITL